ncbi:EPS15 [Acanthosepion pharaonis]|uniref:EPS15 n=1 Tax=Acanthosepion pharaonis TaxID=158019 RepID=A0A812EJ77_ACAPH|nr:EPS15 [Sepia pharaonis]
MGKYQHSSPFPGEETALFVNDPSVNEKVHFFLVREAKISQGTLKRMILCSIILLLVIKLSLSGGDELTSCEIVGPHAGIYEGYYLQADPTNSGSIGAHDAARFLKKSSLKENVLSQIWDLSDPTGKGYLEKPGFFVALKLIALAQIGHEISLARLPTDTPPPNLGPVEPVLSPPDPVIMSPPPSAGANWAVLVNIILYFFEMTNFLY